MKEIDATAFEQRLAKCAPETRDLIGFLKVVAENAGVSPSVDT